MTHFRIRRIKTRVRFLRFFGVIEPIARSANRRIIFSFGQSAAVWRETPVERESIRKMQQSAYSPHRARLLWPEGWAEKTLFFEFMKLIKNRKFVIFIKKVSTLAGKVINKLTNLVSLKMAERNEAKSKLLLSHFQWKKIRELKSKIIVENFVEINRFQVNIERIYWSSFLHFLVCSFSLILKIYIKWTK